jgi:Protein of unknown function (DUF3987)/Primase C terminal 2 (PriCT-2)
MEKYFTNRDFPSPLNDLKAFLLWKKKPIMGKVKFDKIPYYANGNIRGAHGTDDDKAQLVTLQEAIEAFRGRGYSGIGIALSRVLGIVALDFDGCILNGQINPTVVELCRGSYTEISPSGNGIRAVFTGYYPKQVKKISTGLSIEVYSENQFVTLTGDADNPFYEIGCSNVISPMPEHLLSFLDQNFGARKSTAIASNDDDDLLEGLTPKLGVTFEQVRETLRGIDPSHGRDTWLKVLQGVHHELGNSEAVIDLLDEWSSGKSRCEQTPDNYTGTRDVRSCVRSLGKSDSVTPVTFKSVIELYKDENEGELPDYYANADIPALPTGADGWPDLVPLPDQLPPVAPYDDGLLPPVLSAFVKDVSHRMQCPPDFLAVSLVTTLSSLIGARKVVQPKVNDPWQVVPNLWGLNVGRAGTKKSPAIGEALKPVHKLESKHRESHTLKMDEWRKKEELSKLKVAKAKATISKADYAGSDAQAAELLQDAEPPEKPKMRRTIVNDATVEKLGVILQDTPDGLLVYRDEIYGLFCDLDKPGQEGSRGFYLTAFDGDKPYSVERMSREEVRIDRLCFSLLGGIQPGRIHDYVVQATTGGTGDDGLLQRFSLTVWPDMNQHVEYVDKLPNAEAMQNVQSLFDKLNALPARGSNAASVMRFSNAAQSLYAQWAEGFDKLLLDDDLPPAMVSHLSKYRKLVPSLALIFCTVERSFENDEIEAHHFQMALRWVEYLRSHAERLYSPSLRPELKAATLLLSKIVNGQALDGDNSFSIRHVVRKAWSGLGDQATVQKAISLLELHEYVRRCSIPPDEVKGGRPSIVYVINPKLLCSRKD